MHRKFQRQLKAPAVQLVDEGEAFRRSAGGDHAVLVAPAHMWLPRLP